MESIKHGVKAGTLSVNHTIGIGIVEETGYGMGGGGGVQDTSFAFKG